MPNAWENLVNDHRLALTNAIADIETRIAALKGRRGICGRRKLLARLRKEWRRGGEPDDVGDLDITLMEIERYVALDSRLEVLLAALKHPRLLSHITTKSGSLRWSGACRTSDAVREMLERAVVTEGALCGPWSVDTIAENRIIINFIGGWGVLSIRPPEDLFWSDVMEQWQTRAEKDAGAR